MYKRYNNNIKVSFFRFQPDYARHSRITILGYEYFHLTGNQICLQTFKNNKILHYWTQKLSKYLISYKGLNQFITLIHLLPYLILFFYMSICIYICMSLKNILIKNICRTFNK